jgi:predicted nucleic acid-binding protein
MIVLDTNVISELMRAEPEGAVLDWFARQPMAGLFTTAISQAEIYYGLALLPEGKRREALQGAARAMFEEDFAGRILPFDTDAAHAYADIASARRLGGQPISQLDAQIAGAARSRGAQLATRNLRDFVDCGISLADPWTGK